MTQQIPFSNSKFNKGISPEQLNQIVEAILAGKYSWACFLLLRCMGYNPLHYIPYRTYNRLLKENCQVGKPSGNETKKSAQTKSKDTTSGNHLSLISDLAYVEDISEEPKQVQGGNHHLGFNLFKAKFMFPKF